ncbi:hypothetical protein GMES_4445 [Paraglaciecola mesophila KMM 241]|uniref:Uncharacterized protein n=2 Tax=Paraglaciecola mesophila TaxID=197222 RepID=K6YRV5_9ALTE|nr:hypothetical protein GMES_4445 [Paraglaciecola mesophila KMM 241]
MFSVYENKVDVTMSASEQEFIRRSTRLLTAVHELHKQGYQNLAVYTGMSSSGFNWRLELFDYYDLTASRQSISPSKGTNLYETAQHSAGENGNQYFGWEDSATASARELAEQIKQRFPRLIHQCKAVNFEYAGWLTYILGEAENGALPVMYSDYYSVGEGNIASTQVKELIAPPHCEVESVNGRQFIYVSPPNLKNHDDWHKAYIPIVNSFRQTGIAKFPLYSKYTANVCEMGAYWEGAIYYIQHILGFTKIDAFLLAAEGYEKDSEHWSTFFLVWDNDNQFAYLKAFLITKMLKQIDKYPKKSAEREKWVAWLDDFKRENAENNKGKPVFYNPYFGGTNPLHLGGVFNGSGRDQDNLLNSY